MGEFKRFCTIAVLLISGIFLGVLLLLAFAFIFALIKMSRLRRQSSVPAVPDDSDDDQRLLEA